MADGFNPAANGAVLSIAVQADGKILASGVFTIIDGQSRNYIARLESLTGVADSFNPNPNVLVSSIILQPDGKILAFGPFTDIGGQVRNHIARLDPATGQADASFNPSAGNRVLAVAVQTDGKILVGGSFTTLGGENRSLFARLINDTPAMQYLAVAQSTVTWTRVGSSPQFTRVTFESSTDRVNYISLGNATATGTNWTLTGLSIPTGQLLNIRARGYYSGSYQSGSGSIVETMRDVFLSQPAPSPFLNIQRSGNTNVVLSWATSATGFTLESKINLNTNVWSVVTNEPAVSGTNNVVTNAVSDSSRFYRLRK